MEDRTVILVIDDSPQDRFFIHRALGKSGDHFDIIDLWSAEIGTEYLLGLGPFADRERFPMPVLAIVDIKMPGQDGFWFIDWLRSQQQFEHVAVAAMTGACSEESSRTATSKGACACIDKGDLMEHPAQFIDAVRDCIRGVATV
jgi:CheY-like chemotaxis protein